MTLPADDWVTLAVLGKTRGNRGEITASVVAAKPDRFESLREVYLFRSGTDDRISSSVNPPHRGTGDSPSSVAPFTIESTWWHGPVLVFKFQGVDSISDAETLTGSEVRIPLNQRAPLEPGEFFQSDLVGCDVIDRRTGASVGHVSRWDDAGSGLLVLDTGLLVPFARSICVEIDPAARRIAVELPEGLADLNPS